MEVMFRITSPEAPAPYCEKIEVTAISNRCRILLSVNQSGEWIAETGCELRFLAIEFKKKSTKLHNFEMFSFNSQLVLSFIIAPFLTYYDLRSLIAG